MSKEPRQSAKTSWWVGPCLLFATLTLLLCLTEALVRLAHLAPDVGIIEKWRYQLAVNPLIGYEPRPGIPSEDVDVQYFSYRGKSNSFGYRDDDHPLKKPTDVFRIALLGDSVALGLWINEDEKIFASVLQEDLRAMEGEIGKKIELLNFSVAGYNTRQEVETLKEKVLPYKPDLVILNYCQNDRERDDGGVYLALLEAERSGGQLSQSRLLPFLSKSALYRFVTFRVMHGGEPERFEEYQNKTWELVGGDTVEDSLRELGELSQKESFQVLLALFPKFAPKGRSIESTDESGKLSTEAKRNEFLFLDLTPAFENCLGNDESLMAYDAFHLTIEGHRCAGHALSRELAGRVFRLNGTSNETD